LREFLDSGLDGRRCVFKVSPVDTVTSEDLRWELTRVAAAVVAGDRVTVTHRGKAHFALVPLGDLQRLEELDSKPAKKTKRSK